MLIAINCRILEKSFQEISCDYIIKLNVIRKITSELFKNILNLEGKELLMWEFLFKSTYAKMTNIL